LLLLLLFGTLHKTRTEVFVFYTNFVKLCNQKGVSPSAAAEEMGFQRSVVTRWSKGVAPRAATVAKVADYFEVASEELLVDKKENPTSVTADGVDELDKEALDIMHQLPPEKRAAGLAMLRGLLNN
jgi:transcriptional regulator with XRE-family HTH domain